MSIRKETIKFNNKDLNLVINLSGNNEFTGYQQEIDNFTEKTKIELINPVVDNEVSRFQYDSSDRGPVNILFYFTRTGTEYNNTFDSTGAGFSYSEINKNNAKIQNSFFIMDVYDSYDNYTQNKLFTTYLTKILDGDRSGIINNRRYGIPKYRIYNDTVNQLYTHYIPKSYVEIHPSSNKSLYAKFSFYNADTGRLYPFYNKDRENQQTPLKMYFNIRIDVKTMRWKFLSYGFGSSNDVVAYQIPTHFKYVNKVNAGIEKFDNEQQNYPEGNTFDEDGTYSIT